MALTIQEILALPPQDALDILTKEPNDIVRNLDEWQKQYNPADHKIQTDKSDGYYPDKKIKDEDGNITSIVKVPRESIAYQKKIVNSKVAFLVGKPVQLSLSNEDAVKEDGTLDTDTIKGQKEAFGQFELLWDDNNLDYFNQDIVEITGKDSKAAEIWYIAPKEIDGKQVNQIKVMLLSADKGDKFWPHYDQFGEMDAFTRQYTVLDVRGKPIIQTDIYTNESVTSYQQHGGTLTRVPLENQAAVNALIKAIGVIPAVYYDQLEPEWLDVQSVIDPTEKSKSKFTNTGWYFAQPTMVFQGEVKNLQGSNSDGRTLIAEPIYDEKGNQTFPDKPVDIVQWDQSPDMIQTEWNMSNSIIYDMTDTPDLSLNNLKGLSNASAAMLELMFLAPISKALRGEKIFGLGFQQRITVMLAMLAVTTTDSTFRDLSINISFTSILPKNLKELIETLSDARGGKAFMSLEEGVNRLGTKNPVREVELIKEEAAQESAIVPGSFDPAADNEDE